MARAIVPAGRRLAQSQLTRRCKSMPTAAKSASGVRKLLAYGAERDQAPAGVAREIIDVEQKIIRCEGQCTGSAQVIAAARDHCA
jgi:hypothetical protein